MTTLPIQEPVREKDVQEIFRLQKRAQVNADFRSYKKRMDRVNRVHKATLKYRDQIKAAIYADFQKPAPEVDISEILPVTTEAKFIRKKLARWMRDERVPVPITLLGNRSYIKYEPKGVVLIIAPWNFPYLLIMGPMISAFAAGNSVILKPSEMTPHTSALMAKIVAEYFSPEEVALFEGGVETSEVLLRQPFNHIFFTGSTRVGKIIMKAAAQHLASVTLELGGKSPTVVDETANIRQAAYRVLWAKCLNAGQICISPDYVFVHEKVQAAFTDHLRQAAEDFFRGNPKGSADYARIINDRNFERLQASLDEAVKLGARIEMGGQTAAEDRYIAPTVLSEVPLQSKVMQEEIFGPILPLIPFSTIEEPIRHIQAGEKPLSMYIFSRNRRNIRRLINETQVGGTSVNISLVHFFNHHLPFGGSNNSGIGKAHGHYGFKAFSNARGISEQKLPSVSDLIRTPYTQFKQKLVDLTIKWL